MSITEDSSPEARAIHVSGVLNVRDLGGLVGEQGTIRKGLILRTAALDLLTEEGAQTLADLGLRTVIDLRTQEEREDAPDRISQWPLLSDVREVWHLGKDKPSKPRKPKVATRKPASDLA